jgi:hypothetical protein
VRFNIKEKVKIGQWVLYSPHKGNSHWTAALVVFVGDESIECTVYAYNGYTSSAVHRGGVRHESDPLWEDPSRVANIIEEGDGGCFVQHPDTVLLQQLAERVADLEAGSTPAGPGPVEGQSFPRRKKKVAEPEINAPVSDNSFREPTAETAPALTAEQKQLRAEALKAAMASA